MQANNENINGEEVQTTRAQTVPNAGHANITPGKKAIPFERARKTAIERIVRYTPAALVALRDAVSGKDVDRLRIDAAKALIGAYLSVTGKVPSAQPPAPSPPAVRLRAIIHKQEKPPAPKSAPSTPQAKKQAADIDTPGEGEPEEADGERGDIYIAPTQTPVLNIKASIHEERAV
jgi:hypothetical protein